MTDLKNLNSILTHDFNQMLQRNDVLQRERDEALAKILRLIARLETAEVQRNIAVNANKRANAALREANAKIIRLARAYE